MTVPLVACFGCVVDVALALIWRRSPDAQSTYLQDTLPDICLPAQLQLLLQVPRVMQLQPLPPLLQLQVRRRCASIRW